jgi:Cu-Zn family superoxide dismutase
MIGRIIFFIFLILQPFIGNAITSKFFNSMLNTKNREWYSKLNQSPLTPPSIVFPIVWSILYLLLGLSAVFYLMGKKLLPNLVSYIAPYEVQMLLNFSWSVVFFGLQKPKISLIIIFAMIGLTGYLLWISWGKKLAFWTLLPYFLWILFAMYLNFYIVANNMNNVKAVCVLDSQTNKKDVSGVIYLEETNDNKTRIHGSIRGLKPGLHGFHIHEAGDMTKGCDSACAHYNPHGHNHGGLTSKKRHVGDLGNIEAGKNGVAKIDIIDRFVKLRGKYTVVGRSLVVHEDEDDLGMGNHHDSHTTGHSGKRLACGVIGYAKI